MLATLSCSHSRRARRLAVTFHGPLDVESCTGCGCPARNADEVTLNATKRLTPSLYPVRCRYPYTYLAPTAKCMRRFLRSCAPSESFEAFLHRDPLLASCHPFYLYTHTYRSIDTICAASVMSAEILRILTHASNMSFIEWTVTRDDLEIPSGTEGAVCAVGG